MRPHRFPPDEQRPLPAVGRPRPGHRQAAAGELHPPRHHHGAWQLVGQRNRADRSAQGERRQAGCERHRAAGRPPACGPQHVLFAAIRHVGHGHPHRAVGPAAGPADSLNSLLPVPSYAFRLGAAAFPTKPSRSRMGSLMAGGTRIYELMRSGDWLDRARILACARILLVVEVAVFLFLIAGTHGWIVPLDHPLTTDFASFYAAGDQRVTEPEIQYQFFYYPPVFLLICALLARLPYLAAFIVFEAASLALYLVVTRRILDEPGRAALVPMLAFPAVFWTMGLGQNALLTAALFGAGILSVDRRPGWAGVLFGALCYKPHLALLIPVALAAGRRWQAFAAAAATVAALALGSAGLFGWETWQAYLGVAADSHATYELGRINLAGMISPFAAARLLGFDVGIAYAIQGVATLAAAVLVALVWRRDQSLELRGASLAAATLLAVPVVLLYDFMLAAVAAAFLVRAARRTGFLPWEKAALVLVFVLPLLTLGVGQGWSVPVGPLASLLLLAMTLARVKRVASGHPSATLAGATGT